MAALAKKPPESILKNFTVKKKSTFRFVKFGLVADGVDNSIVFRIEIALYFGDLSMEAL